jgi:hypothetical protein
MKLTALVPTLALLCLSHAMTGCSFGSHEGSGLVDRPAPRVPQAPDVPGASSFHFVLSRGCAPTTPDACALDRPLMTDVTEMVRFTVAGVARDDNAVVTSSDPAVLALDGPDVGGTLSGDTYEALFLVHAIAPGRATLTITRDGVTLGTAVVRVDDAADLAVVVEDDGTPATARPADRLVVRTGARLSLDGRPVNLAGERLYANNVVTWTVPDTSRVNLTWASQSGTRIDDDHVYVEGRGRGVETLSVRAGRVARTVDVEVQ